jgi:hypothetical protein
MSPNYINLICLQILSTWYVSKFYQLDMFWMFISVDRSCIFINTDMPLISIHLICVDIYQVDRSWIFINADKTLISINTDMFWIFIKLIEVGYQSTWYVLDIYQLDDSHFYQLDRFWIFIHTNTSPISINLIWLHSINIDMPPKSINLMVLDIYPHEYVSILFMEIRLGYLSTLIFFQFIFPRIRFRYLLSIDIDRLDIYSCW